MAGSKEGALKARQTNIERYGADFYKKIARRSWSDPKRSRAVGFALNKDLASEVGRKGGKKTKNEYKPKEPEWTTAEDMAALAADIDSM